ncbi:MAG TPA: sigma-54 dependent transcriptional regulator [Methylomirabilota bacterium]|nr:sigma-54 dependent transcriptional regulator [Methylomirabilota bacterium]
MKPRILVVDDDPLVRSFLIDALELQAFEVVSSGDAGTALQQVRAEVPEIVILDLRLPGLSGMEALRRLKEIAPQLPVVILTGYGDVPSAVEAMRLGAYDFLTKPVEAEKILIVVQRALERQAPGTELKALQSKLGQRDALRWLMGRGQHIQQVIQQIRQVANSNFTILIQGETGTGKELVARSIHQLSARRDEPFVPLDCGAIPETLIESELFGYEKGAFTGADRRKEGHFQLAERGTLFLDEIVNLPFPTQAKLLRTLEERRVQVLGAKRALPVDVRIIAAANVPLDREIRAGRFRQDLYYRLNEFVILVPPLRERIEDIIYLAERFLAEASMELRRPIRGISQEAVQLLLRYHWPGNVRELRNAIRRAVLLSSDLIEPAYLLPLPPSSSSEAPPAEVSAFSPAQLSLKEMARKAAAEAERWAIRQALRASGGNKSEAARTLRTDYKTLHLKMRHYGIRSREFLGS